MAKVSTFRWQVAQFLEFYWWRRYLRKMPATAYRERKKAYWKALLTQMGIEPTPGQSALDAGCGPSGIFMVLKGLEVDAVDPLLTRYAEGLEIFQQEEYPGVRFHPASFEEWPLDRAYDLVFCMNAVNHFRDMGVALQKLRQAMIPGGKLLLAVDAHTVPGLRQLFRMLPGDLLHPHQYDAAGYRAQLEAAGFEIQQEKPLKKGRIFDYVAFVAVIPSPG